MGNAIKGGTMLNYGVTIEEMNDALYSLSKSNPSLSWFDKFLLIRQIKKSIKKEES